MSSVLKQSFKFIAWVYVYNFYHSYLSCRCQFLEESVYLRFYEKSKTEQSNVQWLLSLVSSSSESDQMKSDRCDPKELRSRLLELIKQEVQELCIPPLKEIGYSPPHLQVRNGI